MMCDYIIRDVPSYFAIKRYFIISTNILYYYYFIIIIRVSTRDNFFFHFIFICSINYVK